MKKRAKVLSAFAALMSLVAAGAEPTINYNARGEAVISVQQQDNKDNSAPVQQVVVPASMQYILPRSFAKYFRAQQPIWIGKKKRGNRRNRSRFTYFR